MRSRGTKSAWTLPGLALLFLATACRSQTASEAPPLSFEAEKTVPPGTVLVLEFADDLSSETSKTDDRFIAVVIEPVFVDERVVIDAGSKVTGRIIDAVPARGGDGGGRARLGLVITGLKPRDGAEIPIRACFEISSLGGPIDAAVERIVLKPSTEGMEAAIAKGARVRIRLDAPVTVAPRA